MNVNQLSATQLQELAENHLAEHYHDYNPDAAPLEGPSYGELAAALEIVGHAALMDEYADVEFSPDDFFCSAGKSEPTIYEIREIDAWAYNDGWGYNATYKLGTFTTAAQDEPRAFRRALARLGIRFHRGKTRTEFDGDVYEIVDRKTGEPLFCAVPVGQV